MGSKGKADRRREREKEIVEREGEREIRGRCAAEGRQGVERREREKREREKERKKQWK